METSKTDRFDAEAKGWDSNPTVVESSRRFLDTIKTRFPTLAQGEKDKRALEIGCGTGLLSVELAPLVGEYIAFDPSKGMIEVLTSKIAQLPASTNLTPVAEMLTDPKTPHLKGKPVDYAFSHLTLHHIPDMQEALNCIFGTLGSGGKLVFSDFEASSESEEFHPKDKHDDVERHGIVAKELEDIIKKAGFVDVTVDHSFTMSKPVESGGSKMFPFLIAVATRP